MDINHTEFCQSVLNKTVVDTKRWGKYFVLGKFYIGHAVRWIELSAIIRRFSTLLMINSIAPLVFDEGPHIVAHFGMTGSVQVKYTVPTFFFFFFLKV